VLFPCTKNFAHHLPLPIAAIAAANLRPSKGKKSAAIRSLVASNGVSHYFIDLFFFSSDTLYL
jgi:hypothetical protein